MCIKDRNVERDKGAPVWEPFGWGRGQRLRFEVDDTRMEPVDQDQASKCEMWRGFAPTMEQ